jgi:hypothetical protein
MRLPGLAAAIAIPSWIILAVLLGNTGLQRMVSGDPSRLVEQPVPLLLSAGVAFAVAFAGARRLGGPEGSALELGAWLLLLNVMAGALGVLLVGELTVSDIVITTAAVSGIGAQILAGVAGYLLGHRVTSTTS